MALISISTINTSLKTFGSLKCWLLPFAIFTLYFKSVSGHKTCSYESDSGSPSVFQCNDYEFCCGMMCCRARSIGFFQLWYFWLLIMLMLLLCSGGGWWARYSRHYRMEPPHFGYPTAIPMPAPLARNYAPSANLQTGIPRNAPPPYMANSIYIPQAQTNGLHVNLPPQTQNSALPAQVSYPPPTYLGAPPPSYDVAMGQAPS